MGMVYADRSHSLSHYASSPCPVPTHIISVIYTWNFVNNNWVALCFKGKLVLLKNSNNFDHFHVQICLNDQPKTWLPSISPPKLNKLREYLGAELE